MTFNFNKKQNAGFFPYSPELSSWDNWNGNLVVHYGQINIPHVSEENWRDVAEMLASSTTLSVYPVATSQGFDSWQKWAEDFITIINGPSY